MAKKPSITTYKIDGSSNYSENCWDCGNLTDLSEHVCAIHGECPMEYWEDETPCPDRISEEQSTKQG